MAKKSSQQSQKKQVSPMPPPRTHITSGGKTASHHNPSPLQDDDDDDLDDICPVCESECTCPKKSTSTTLPTPSAPSITSSVPSSNHPVSAGKRPLKIKLTLPPNLKLNKSIPTHPTGAQRGSAAQGAGPSSFRQSNAGAVAPVPKRRGRPPKALATAKYNAKKKAAADDMEYKVRGTTGSSTIRRVYQPPVPVASSSAADLTDSTLSDYPTFVPAARESTHSSSSQSSDSEIDSSSSDDDHHFMERNEEARHSVKLLPSHVGHTKRERGGGARREVRSRKTSVGKDEEGEDESSADSDESSENSSEDGDDEEEDDEEAEADGEEAHNGVFADEGMDLDEEAEETHSRIGVTFPGTGWSDDDEESSFDADLFFANLDSDSGGSSPEMHFAGLNAFSSEDVAFSTFSAEEDDGLLLMDLDPSVQLRRGHGEFEFGVDINSNAFGWDSQPFAHTRNREALGLSFGSFGIQAPDADEDMGSLSGSEATELWEGSAVGTVMLHESDGDTTEDELVDSDGLPNPRAMMLFQWPTTISAINPLSTLSPVSHEPPANASPSTRIALASISAQRRSPPPTPSPADILAGKVSMDDLEDIEMDRIDQAAVKVRRRRGSNVPLMGEFVMEDRAGRTAIVGIGGDVPSFYPRAVRIPKDVEPEDQTVPSPTVAPMGPPHPNESSEETHDPSYTSELSSTEAIELDDVLDSSLLDSEPSMQEYEVDMTDFEFQSSPVKLGASPHLQNLSRWDRIPMATFRRTRESATASGVDGAASDSALGALQYNRGIGTMMGGMSLYTPPRPLGLDKMSRASARKKRARHSHGSSPTLPPTRDGILGSPFVDTFSVGGHTHKSKKELKKEKAMMKKKLLAKASQHRYHQPNRTHHHHPNLKSRPMNAVQRTSFASSSSSVIPSLTI